MTVTRRDLFCGALATGATLALPRARAATTPGPRVLIQIFLYGGMDAVLTTDPKTRREVAPEIDVPYGEGEIHALGPHRVGPVLAPLGRHLSRAAIVNGVVGGTVSHVTGVEQIHEMRRVYPGTGLGLTGTLGLLAGWDPPIGDVRFNRYEQLSGSPTSNGRTLTIKRPGTPDESVVARLHGLAQDPRRKAAVTVALAEQLHGRVDPPLPARNEGRRLLAAIPSASTRVVVTRLVRRLSAHFCECGLPRVGEPARFTTTSAFATRSTSSEDEYGSHCASSWPGRGARRTSAVTS